MANSFLFILFVVPAAVLASAPGRLLMRDIPVVTGQQHAWTTGRVRSQNQQQLQCKGGDACQAQSPLLPSVIQCYNRGWDGTRTHWACEASLDARVKLGATNVRCEGWDFSGDEYVRSGSCVTDYELFYVPIPPPPPPTVYVTQQQPRATQVVYQDKDGVLWLLIALVLLAIVMLCFYSPASPSSHTTETIVVEREGGPPLRAPVTLATPPRGFYTPRFEQPTFVAVPPPVVVIPPAPAVVHHHQPASVITQRQQHVSKGFGTGSSD